MPYEGLIAKGGQWNGQIMLVPEKLLEPLRWQRPRRIFVNSMSDLFHDNVPDWYIDKVFAVMALAEKHTFQVLTKRPRRMRDYCQQLAGRADDIAQSAVNLWGGVDPDAVWQWVHDTVSDGALPNVWLGVSVEDQDTADARIPWLLETPAAVRWLSAEPLLGPIHIDILHPTREPAMPSLIDGIDWIVAGGESGRDARPMHPEWVRGLRDQCRNAKVAFLFKQWGEWSPRAPANESGAFQFDGAMTMANDGTLYSPPDLAYPNGARHAEALRAGHDKASLTNMYKLGKKAAGRHLDGVLHDGYPEGI